LAEKRMPAIQRVLSVIERPSYVHSTQKIKDLFWSFQILGPNNRRSNIKRDNLPFCRFTFYYLLQSIV